MAGIAGVNSNLVTAASGAAVHNRLSAAGSALGEAKNAGELRDRLGEFLGGVFFAPVLQEMQKSPFKTRYSDGGRGEQAFAGQLSLELAKRAGRSAAGGFAKHLIDDISARVKG